MRNIVRECKVFQWVLIASILTFSATMAQAGELTLCEDNQFAGCELVIAASGANEAGVKWERFCPVTDMGLAATDMEGCLAFAQQIFDHGMRVQAYLDSGVSILRPSAVTCHYARNVDYEALEGRTFYTRGFWMRDYDRVRNGPGITHHTSDDWGL